MPNRTITVPEGDVVLHLSIEDAEALRAGAMSYDTFVGRRPDTLERLHVLAPYLTLVIEQTIRGGGNDARFDTILPDRDSDEAILARSIVHGSRERVFDATDQDPT